MIEREDVVRAAEQGLVGSVLCDPQYALPRAVEAGVMPDWFSEPRWRVLWAAVLDVFSDRGGGGDGGMFAVAVLDRARKNAARLAADRGDVPEVSAADVDAAISAHTTSAYIEAHVGVLRSEAMIRKLAGAQKKFRAALDGGWDVQDAIAELNGEITGILAGAMGAKTTPPAKIVETVLGEYREARRIRIDEGRLDYTPGIPLPWPAVNRAANGVQEGLYYVGARPSVGKTAFVLNFVRFWCERGVKVGFDSLDMAPKQLMKRPVGELARVSFAKASFGTTTHEDMEAMERAAEKIAAWPLTLADFRDVDKLRAWTVAMRRAGRMDVLLVDFVQLLRSRHRFGNTEERIEYVSGVLKSIAVDLSMPVIALSQLNRECEKDGGRVPTASDLRGSGALEQDAFAVWMLHREKQVKARWEAGLAAGGAGVPLGLTAGASAAEFKGVDPVRFIIAKNQNGQAGPDTWFPFVFYKKYCALMLGDYEASPAQSTTGYGVTAKTESDWSPLYARVHSDWRHDPLEAALARNGALIADAPPQMVQQTFGAVAGAE